MVVGVLEERGGSAAGGVLQGDAGRVSELGDFDVEQLVGGGGVKAGERLEFYALYVCWVLEAHFEDSSDCLL